MIKECYCIKQQLSLKKEEKEKVIEIDQIMLQEEKKTMNI